MKNPKTIRLGIVGMGNIGKHHADYILAGKVPRCELSAVCSTSPTKLEAYKERGVAVYDNADKLFHSTDVDAVIIATPHPQHPAQAKAAFEAGLHVVVEKPIAAHKADAERLIVAARKHPAQRFAAMFQLRFEPRYMRIRELIRSGQLGDIVRISWIITDWYRTEAYYASGGWRATWKGEGGGVLINQCLHQLDMLQWLCGMPSRVRGFCQLGRYHSIEVEDNVTCYLEWPGGATGVFISSTGETPGSNRFELAGTRGRIVLENNKLIFSSNSEDMLAFSKSSTSAFAKPESSTTEIPFETNPIPHVPLMENFVAAIIDGTPLVAPGEDGLHSIELANALLYSSLVKETIEMPLNGAAYERKLNDLIASSKVEKKVVAISTEDFAKSFNR